MAHRDHELEAALGHQFDNVSLLGQALTHRGAALSPEESNERLEFLGDRVLGLVVADMLCRRFPSEEEGALARRFSSLVRRDALARIATDIGLASRLILTQTEIDSGSRDNPALLADACEAVIAALYRDGGLAAAAGFIGHRWSPLLEEDPTPPLDAKTALQEWAQGCGLTLPVYEERKRLGPAHAPTFTIAVMVDGLRDVQAEGSSKRVAEQAAASLMLQEVQALVEGDKG